MIDSVALVWGRSIGVGSRRVKKPSGDSNVEPLSPPIELDIGELHARLGSEQGQVRKVVFDRETADGERESIEPAYGHWKVGDVELLYREGRVELRASLPKLVTGRNDALLDERGVHDGLRELAAIGSELAQHPLELRLADPSRLDYVYQWDVPDVGWMLEHIKAALPVSNKLLTENTSPMGGHSIAYGYGRKRVIRFYDKRAEVAEQMAKAGELGRGKDRQRALAELRKDFGTLLRYEIQERRRDHLRLVHEREYQARDVRHELEQTIHTLGKVAARDVEAVLRAQGTWDHAVAYGLGALYLVDHDEAWTAVRRVVSDSTYYRWKQRARAVALMIADVPLVIPPDAFDVAGAGLWKSAA